MMSSDMMHLQEGMQREGQRVALCVVLYCLDSILCICIGVVHEENVFS